MFPLSEVTGITFNQQTRANGPPQPPLLADPFLSLLKIIPGAVGVVAFGKYESPDYEIQQQPGAAGEFIPPVGTRTGTPARARHQRHLFQPLSARRAETAPRLAGGASRHRRRWKQATRRVGCGDAGEARDRHDHHQRRGPRLRAFGHGQSGPGDVGRR